MKVKVVVMPKAAVLDPQGNAVRDAMHSAFLFHAIHAGLDMGIVNAGRLAVYEEIPKGLLERAEDVLLNRRPDATERLLAFADSALGPVGFENAAFTVIFISVADQRRKAELHLSLWDQRTLTVSRP